MAQRRRFTIGCTDGACSRASLERAVDAIRDASPRIGIAAHGECSRSFAALAQALVKGGIDVAVADAREIPDRMPSGIEIAAIPKRVNPFDVLVSAGTLLDDIPEGAPLVTVFEHTLAQVLYYRPDLDHVLARSSIDSLFDDLAAGRIAGFVCPAADIEAVNLQEHVTEVFTSSVSMPAPGQGIVALLARAGDRDVEAFAGLINDTSSVAEYGTERMLLAMLPGHGRCHVGVLANYEDEQFHIEGSLTAPDGTERVVASVFGMIGREAPTVGELAEELSAAGGQMMKSYR
ncbi:MAG: hypothetical protein JW876_03500 [Candidatus Krumholzibacteriota bacterium]|nr:hypothetical protein [Candidatus Krumholzibacteriota bacterium]